MSFSSFIGRFSSDGPPIASTLHSFSTPEIARAILLGVALVVAIFLLIWIIGILWSALGWMGVKVKAMVETWIYTLTLVALLYFVLFYAGGAQELTTEIEKWAVHLLSHSFNDGKLATRAAINFIKSFW